MVRVVSKNLQTGKPFTSLLRVPNTSAGRNHHGRITTRHRGGGHKRRYRIIDFRRNKDHSPAIGERVEYDPNGSAHIALVRDADGERRYIIAPKALEAGQSVLSGLEAPIQVGNTLPVRNIPVGTTI